MAEDIGHSSIPKDFPRANLIDEVLVNYQLCEELVRHVVDEVRKEQLQSPLLATPEIVAMHLETARNFGWEGFPGEIEWIFRNVVRELGCDMPELLVTQAST
ncbi:hypothetical protein [Massilia sp. WG5]|uniref:hypothetical protein n=1 Tax=Massilia sp. WG5 TaxID=1707785 RepID=UPI000D69FC27|nr:hypothetical protein [Massilia sp. WG5]